MSLQVLESDPQDRVARLCHLRVVPLVTSAAAIYIPCSAYTSPPPPSAFPRFYALKMFSSRTKAPLVQIQISLLGVRCAANESGGADAASSVRENKSGNITRYCGNGKKEGKKCRKGRKSVGFLMRRLKILAGGSGKASRLRHHVGFHPVFSDWNGWEYVNRLNV